ncbi:F-box/kelch-repeat protein At3g23880-like [Trifolium pratense]|nr:F-box/kelch-repeat protein At3g23880-like [Trifolium pratense]XP_045823774.1 F-box/kelch-repeat protein At3g23880-like [Trifolium pratense]CAJ2641530.1 unnamed protein product [Trifolium pratense]
MALHSNGTTGTILSSPSLPLELVEEEILSRLPVKKLLQLRCICKSWKSLISDDPKFTKKHLRMSNILKHKHLIMNVLGDRILWDSPLSSVFSNVYNHTVTLTQLNIPISISNHILKISSCDGILCLTLGVVGGGRRYVVLCNPSLRKYTTLPPLENHQKREVLSCLFSFGYDHVNDVYKVIAISCFKDKHKVKEVDVYTLGTNNWRSIQDFPYSSPSPSPSMYHSGVFVGGTVNWLAYEVSNSSHRRVIVSLDLMTESYQKLLQPDLEKDPWILGMCQNCLCIFQCRDMFLDVWIMKEYGNKESWTKLYNIPSAEGQNSYPRTVYISDNNQVLFCYHDLRNSKLKLVVYNSKNGNVMIPKIQHNDRLFMNPRVYVESLISLPCSY